MLQHFLILILEWLHEVPQTPLVGWEGGKPMPRALNCALISVSLSQPKATHLCYPLKVCQRVDHLYLNKEQYRMKRIIFVLDRLYKVCIILNKVCVSRTPSVTDS
jgi:hypothetical protein